MKYLLLILPLLVLAALPGFGASAYLGGYSGLLVTPNEVLVTPGSFDLAFHDFTGIIGDEDLRTYSLTYGLLPNVEVGASIVNGRGSTDIALNGKLSVITETPTRPAIAVGAFDVTGMANVVNDDGTFYIVVSKNLTSTASQIAGRPSVPFRVNLGFGSGVLDGIFAGFDWVLHPRFSLMAEYVNGGFEDDDNQFNVGARWAATNDLRLDIGLIDLDNFAFGLNYRFTR